MPLRLADRVDAAAAAAPADGEHGEQSGGFNPFDAMFVNRIVESRPCRRDS